MNKFTGRLGAQSPGHVLIEPEPEVKLADGGIRRRKRLGGLLSYYYREAALRGFTGEF